MKRTSLRDVAAKAGVSPQTVSRALRGERYVTAALRDKISRLAKRLGYEADPRMKALMGHMRQRKTTAERETMMMVLPDCGVRELPRYYYLREIIRGARAQAEAGGFQLELCSLPDQPDLETLERQWWVRRIELLIIAPFIHRVHAGLGLHWKRYAATTIGPALWSPRLDRTVMNYYLNMIQILHRLKRLGYRRPALVCRTKVLDRLLHVWEAAFRQFAPDGLIWREATENSPRYHRWLRRHGVDAVIGDWHGDLEFLLAAGHRVPEDIGFASLTWNPEQPEITGCDSRMDLLGRHAVDLVAGHYYRNERGVPNDPKVVLHEGIWRAGRTVRKM